MVWFLDYIFSPIQQLTPDLFKKYVYSRELRYTPWLVEFFSPYCEHCKRFEPEFSTVALELSENVKSGKVNCIENTNFCSDLKIFAYPTVVLYTSPHDHHTIELQTASEIVYEVNHILSKKGLTNKPTKK